MAPGGAGACWEATHGATAPTRARWEQCPGRSAAMVRLRAAKMGHELALLKATQGMVLACLKCGCYGWTRLQGLGRRCKGYRSEYGHKAIAALAAGRRPKPAVAAATARAGAGRALVKHLGRVEAGAEAGDALAAYGGARGGEGEEACSAVAAPALLARGVDAERQGGGSLEPEPGPKRPRRGCPESQAETPRGQPDTAGHGPPAGEAGPSEPLGEEGEEVCEGGEMVRRGAVREGESAVSLAPCAKRRRQAERQTQLGGAERDANGGGASSASSGCGGGGGLAGGRAGNPVGRASGAADLPVPKRARVGPYDAHAGIQALRERVRAKATFEG